MSLDAQELERLRCQLLQKQEQLLALDKTNKEASQTVELDQTRVGRLSRMDALQGQAMSQEAGRRRSQELQKIQTALTRMDAGEYGFCLRCEEPVHKARLEVDPAATLCIQCAEDQTT
ncbi:MAG: TraR/DksA C4-type zinc finger protein [Gammaproteobacteria bacterium]|nr:TraR/DksA C4-type zinc finger protein [Gammaproteobacteria bacterium]MDH5802895.1 TraR/DksA C4-type zinc finger protein [Gammaproteobacteria bacterium]